MNFSVSKIAEVFIILILTIPVNSYSQESDVSGLEEQIFDLISKNQKIEDSIVVIHTLKIENESDTEMIIPVDSLRFRMSQNIWSHGFYLVSESEETNEAILELRKYGDDNLENPSYEVCTIKHQSVNENVTTTYYQNSDWMETLIVSLRFNKKVSGKAIAVITQFPRNSDLEKMLAD